MGRNAINKQRNTTRTKTRQWAIDLLPKLQNIALCDLTIDELASLIGKSKSTIYQYFKSKEEIITYTVEVRLESMAGAIAILRDPPFHPKEQYQKCLLLLCEGAQDIAPPFLHDLQLHYPAAWELIAFFLQALIEEMKLFFGRGIESGVFRPFSAELLARIDQFFVFQLITDPKVIAEAGSLDALIHDYLSMRFGGIWRRE